MAWLAIGVTCIISGVGYYLLEGLDQGDEYPFESIYEQLNVLIYGENPGPKNAGARFNMPLWGFVQLVVIAAYTANLATFLLVRSQATRRVNGVGDIISQTYPTCKYDSEPLNDQILAQYGTITNWVDTSSYAEGGNTMMNSIRSTFLPG